MKRVILVGVLILQIHAICFAAELGGWDYAKRTGDIKIACREWDGGYQDIFVFNKKLRGDKVLILDSGGSRVVVEANGYITESLVEFYSETFRRSYIIDRKSENLYQVISNNNVYKMYVF